MGHITRDLVDVLQVAAQVSALSEVLFALFALVGAGARVLAEVVAQVAALAEHAFAPAVATAEEKLRALGLLV